MTTSTGRIPNRPAGEAVGLSPLSRHATHRSKADMPANSDVEDGAAACCIGRPAALVRSMISPGVRPMSATGRALLRSP